ncbi:protein misato homolog 1 [Ipomoea triloba]|uniref:protein misato homolog 1 n=1 Tax=Ipomoea triloba TaxID=35885 RepID=UPI00125D699E|nr:protein misato homolog 1 [Ipomoea triloba]XP_031102793.1 protein misato homolog 1 [Ipomoea triloba]
MKEIVTIQFGSYANFIGSHFWNFQDELHGLADSFESDEVFKNHSLNTDVLYRSGETQQGLLTYTPRLVSVDFQGSLGSMSSCGNMYSEKPSQSSDVLTWAGKVTTQASEPLKRNLFLQSLYVEENKVDGPDGRESDSHNEIQDKDIVECLENGVQYWTDFSKVQFHPQSLYQLSGLWMDAQEFDNYGIGRDTFHNHQRGEEINERLRFFIEECDHIQGIQFIVDDSGGFSGLAAEFLQNIADDYSNVPVLLYTVRSPGSFINTKSQKRNISQSLHNAVSFSRLASFSKLIVPIGLSSLSTSKASRRLCIKDEQPYYTSAVYASALHSLSLPFRMEQPGPTAESIYASGALNMYEVIHVLADQARQNIVSTLDVSMPAPSLTGNQVQWSLLDNFVSLTLEVEQDNEDMHAMECMTIHGVLGSGSRRAPVYEVKRAVQDAYEKAISRPKFSHLSVACCPLPIPLPFPAIFGNSVGQHGELLETPITETPSRGSLDVHSIPMASRLRSSTAILPFLESRLENLRKLAIQRGAIGAQVLESWGFGRDEVEDLGETLSKLVNTLKPYSDISSDSD